MVGVHTPDHEKHFQGLEAMKLSHERPCLQKVPEEWPHLQPTHARTKCCLSKLQNDNHAEDGTFRLLRLHEAHALPCRFAIVMNSLPS